jgi:hypothetical protein
MKYYVTTKDIADTLETSLYQARKIFLDAKCKSKLRFSEREVPARLVNESSAIRRLPSHRRKYDKRTTNHR